MTIPFPFLFLKIESPGFRFYYYSDVLRKLPDLYVCHMYRLLGALYFTVLGEAGAKLCAKGWLWGSSYRLHKQTRQNRVTWYFFLFFLPLSFPFSLSPFPFSLSPFFFPLSLSNPLSSFPTVLPSSLSLISFLSPPFLLFRCYILCKHLWV